MSEGLAQMGKLVTSLFNRAEATPFRQAVDWNAMGLYDYPQIIHHPMDLGTVKQRLENQEYRCAAECAVDVRLVWENCKTYNQEGSPFFLLASNLSKKFEDRYAKIAEKEAAERVGTAKVGDEGSWMATSATSSTGTTDEKIRFCSNLYKASQEQAGVLLVKLDQRCPEAIERVAGDELQLNIDAIDWRTFQDLNKMLTEFIDATKAKKKKRKRKEG